MTPALARALRTLGQAVVAAIGTISISAIFHGLDPAVAGMFQVMLTAVVSQVQNALEDHGLIPMVLKPTPAPVATSPPVDVPSTPAEGPPAP